MCVVIKQGSMQHAMLQRCTAAAHVGIDESCCNLARGLSQAARASSRHPRKYLSTWPLVYRLCEASGRWQGSAYVCMLVLSAKKWTLHVRAYAFKAQARRRQTSLR